MDSGSISVLIAGHEEASRASLPEYLGAEYSCVTVRSTRRSTREAMAQLESARFNLAIADITMVSTSGRPLCNLIRESFPNTVVVATSRFDTVECSIEAMRQGAFDFIGGPFDVAQVIRSVEHALSSGKGLSNPHAQTDSKCAAGTRHSAAGR